MYWKGLVSTSIASVITACCRATAGGNGPGAIHIWIITTVIPSITRSISERIPTSNKIFPLIPYLKQCGDLVWWMLGRMLTLCKRIVSYPYIGRSYARLVVTRWKAVYQSNFAGSWTLQYLNSIILYTTEVSASRACMLSYIDCWCIH